MQPKQSKVRSVKRRSKVRSVKRQSKVRSVKKVSTKNIIDEFRRIVNLDRQKKFGTVLNPKNKIGNLNVNDYKDGKSISYDNKLFTVRTNEKGVKKILSKYF